MVDIRSVASSSRPSRREQEIEGRLLLAPRRGNPVVNVVFLLLQVVIPAMTLLLHRLRLKVVVVQ
jgi:hypothetical protein